MICFLTSSPCPIGAPGLSNANGMVEELANCLPNPCHGLFVASSADDYAACDRFSEDMRRNFDLAGFTFKSYRTLDRRTAHQARAMVDQADLIILAGGHVPTQNAFFADIGLRELLVDFQGVVMGISAGSMNAADVVYAQPEEPGEAVDPAYRRFLRGLNLTKTMVLPHYQMLKDEVLDGLRLFEDISCGDSHGRQFLVLVDGSYLLIRDGREELRGEAYLIQDGVFSPLTAQGDRLILHQ